MHAIIWRRVFDLKMEAFCFTEKKSRVNEILLRMKVSTGFGYLLLIVSQIFCVKTIHSGAPNFKTVYISRKKVPSVPLKQKFRGELYSDGSIGWLCSRVINGRWSEWFPVSETRVPLNMVRQMRSQLLRMPRKVPKVYRERLVTPLADYSGQNISSDNYVRSIQPSYQSSGRQFTWEEEDSSREASPLYLKPMSPIRSQVSRSYNMAAGRQASILQQPSIERRTIPEEAKHMYDRIKVSSSPEDEVDMARYFEEQNASPIIDKKGIKQSLKETFKTSFPELELASPTFRKKPQHMASPQSFQPLQPQQPSDYDLGRMQWKFFLVSFDPRMDNVRIIRNIPPLGMKLSKTVTECTEYYYKAFKLQYLTISGMMYSKKISKSVSNSINRELKQWCSGMMMNWYRQLQKMGLSVPKASKFIR